MRLYFCTTEPRYAHTAYTTAQFLISSYMFQGSPAIIMQDTQQYI